MLAPGRGCAELRAQNVDALVQRAPFVRELAFDASIQGETISRRLPRTSTADPVTSNVHAVVKTFSFPRELTLAALEQYELAGQSVHVVSPLGPHRPHPPRVRRQIVSRGDRGSLEADPAREQLGQAHLGGVGRDPVRVWRPDLQRDAGSAATEGDRIDQDPHGPCPWRGCDVRDHPDPDSSTADPRKLRPLHRDHRERGIRVGGDH
ncbi:MAG TPA: hypothetical protein VFY02_09495, partial [Gaiellaceae bacterium]|nr:hypothetical protein [Gaiellaceae bacterium]